MRIISVEPTPSPNTMKFTLSESLPQGTANNYTKESVEGAPDFIKDILAIDGVTGAYHVADFIAVDRHPKKDWKEVLPAVRKVFGEESADVHSHEVDEHFGEVSVQIQVFKDIPMQVKVTDGESEHREALPVQFIDAVTKATKDEDNVVFMRKWEDQKPRYGALEDVANEVSEELQASYTSERLDKLVDAALQPEKKKVERNWLKVTLPMFEEEDWKKRFAMLEQIDPSLDDLPLLEKALEDEKPSIRRLATIYLGMIEDEQVIPYLEKALSDKSITVRRTAGDAMSDISSTKAMPAMIAALEDKNKLVRWRAAMFLYEIGDETAVPALKKAEEDSEFEVALQAKLALARIESGEKAKGSVWKQMTEAFDND
ncbi:conserved virulence factor C family protein [Paenalkalicoccus suaedae]|uniref:Conserved virulence factor C family protein n=1 Tax=Paenalkalicoccus suaedae TaxID=2592382 RepID=A0A859FEY2_9BACI|nr:conserved virulence factor C family protein [Paenalkalicoccus suaedae]QKS71144.1 conserved virulence factor C family protein [Paenalkalicoccus suaedae]